MNAVNPAVNAALKPWLGQLNQLLAEQKAEGIEATPAMARDSLTGLTAAFVTRHPDIARVADMTIEAEGRSIPVRLYDPTPEHFKPVCLFFHGGGHMAGSIDVYDPIARKLAHYSGQLVVSVDYRLAPESPYPDGLDDCLAVTQALWRALDEQGCLTTRVLSIVGDSGGGTFAATVCARVAGDPSVGLARQILIYPSLDYTLSYPSIRINGEGYLLDASRIRWYFNHYFQHHEDRRTASPLMAPIPENMPATLVITAGFCPLRDEGIAYADALKAAGVTCEHHNFADMIHAYLNLENLVPNACDNTYHLIADFLAP
jgi:acetyl esterase/lipase